ncbi:unnamed protein product [Symbiodinium sp. CCMP2592]|nr:unnamed protein product [Symbiodinium sp. CCMP2592]
MSVIARASSKHEEKTVYEALQKSKLLVDIPWTYVNLGESLEKHPCFRPQDMIATLAKRGNLDAIIGTPAEQSDVVLRDFWKHYVAQYPTHPVASDIASGHVDPTCLVPLNIHGDGGRTYRKSELMILQFQSCIGRGTNLSHGSKKRRLSTETGETVAAAGVNLKGNSLTTRFLMSVLHKRYYSEDPEPLLELLGLVSDWFGSLYRDGYLHEGKTWKFLVLGLKGDLVFQAKATSAIRNYARVRKHAPKEKSKPLLGICCWCMAGTEKCAFEVFDRKPAWLATAGPNNTVPWPAPPSILRSIPHCADDAPSFLKVDLFHTLNLGIYKEFAASSLVLLLQYFEGNNNDERMLAMNAHVQVYLKQTRQRLHCQKLTLETIGAKSKSTFATGTWNKGEDSVVLMNFLPWVMEILPTVNRSEKPWRYIDVGARAARQSMHSLYEAEAFMAKDVARLAADSGFTFLLTYGKLVEWAAQANILLYNLIPKLHYYHHCLIEMDRACDDPELEVLLNPVINSTAQCEDLVGQIARLSRRVSPRLPHSRVLRRYQAALAVKFGLG